MNPASDHPELESASAVERKLAALIDELIEQSRDGKTSDLEAVIREHPDLASELRELWATAMIAE